MLVGFTISGSLAKRVSSKPSGTLRDLTVSSGVICAAAGAASDATPSDATAARVR